MNNRVVRWVERKQTALLPAGSVRARFATGAFWSLLGALVSQGLSLLAAFITARLLGRVGYGELAIVIDTVGTFGIFAGVGLGTTATKYVAELRAKDPGRAGRIMGLSMWAALAAGVFVAVVLFLASPALAAHMLKAPQLADGLRLGCLLLFFNALNGAQVGVLSGFEAFRRIAANSLWRGLVSFPLVVAGVWMLGIMGAVVAMAVAAAFGCWLNELAIRQEAATSHITVAYRGSRVEVPVLWRFAFPAFMSSALYTPVVWAGSAALVNQPNGYAENGLFEATNQLRMAITFLPAVLGQVVVPVLSNLYGEQRGGSYRKVLWANLAATFLISVLVAAPIIVAAPWIMSAYGPEFGGGAPVLVLVTLSTVLSSTAAVIGFAIISIDRMWHGFWLNCLWAAVFLVCVVLFIHQGAIGLALAYLVSYVSHTIWSAVYMLVFLQRSRPANA